MKANTNANLFPIEAKIRDFILRCTDVHYFPENDEFFELSMELFAWQFRNNLAYQNFCMHLGVTPDSIFGSFSDIPAVPVELFRDVDFCCFPVEETTTIFRTSGTTTGRRGEHKLYNTHIYDLGSVIQRNRVIGEIPTEGISLVSDAPDSSLGHMARFFAPNMLQGFQPDGIKHQLIWNYLEHVQSPIFIPATGFSLAALLSERQIPCPLPQGSIIMVTGGFKGKRVQISEMDLQQRLLTIFPNTRIVGEYGMTELSSQLWSPSIGEAFLPPPWMKVCTVDPDSGIPTDGMGLLRFYDLANHQTVLAIETKDLGVIEKDGSVTLYGRIPSSRPRGCSIRVEESDPFFRKHHFIQHPPPACRTIDLSEMTKRASITKRILQDLSHELFVHSSIVQQANKVPFYKEEGLTQKSAQYHYDQVVAGFDIDKLKEELLTHPFFPSKVGIILARGVFVAGLEWLFLCLASTAQITIKPPVGNFHFYNHICQKLSQEGLPISCTMSQDDLMSMDAIVAFGSDSSISNITYQYSKSYICGFGEKLSIAFCDDLDQVLDLARDIFAYATKGCMSPAAIFTRNPHLAMKLRDALEHLVGIFGFEKESDGDERRYRSSVAALTGNVHAYSAGAVYEYDTKTFFTTALPYSPNVYVIKDLNTAYDILQAYKGKISTIGWGLSEISTKAESICTMAHRVCRLGEMQTPPFPRKHDGRMMWKSICGVP